MYCVTKHIDRKISFLTCYLFVCLFVCLFVFDSREKRNLEVGYEPRERDRDRGSSMYRDGNSAVCWGFWGNGSWISESAISSEVSTTSENTRRKKITITRINITAAVAYKPARWKRAGPLAFGFCLSSTAFFFFVKKQNLWSLFSRILPAGNDDISREGQI